MDLAGARVLVTGGAGFIGSHVVEALVVHGATVRVLDDLSVGSRANLAGVEREVELVVGDARDEETVSRSVEGVDVVVHMACDNLRASLGRPLHTHSVNATGSLIAALASARAGVRRFAYVSSSEAYGSAVSSPMSEDHPLRPTTVYGASKAAGELYAQGVMRTYGLPVTIIRPFNSFGPREHSTGTSAEVIPKFTFRMLAGERPIIFGDGGQTRDFTWVEETAAGILAAVACDALVGDAVNIAFGKGVRIIDVCRHLAEFLGVDLEPEYQDERPGDVRHHFAAVDRARALLGFEAQVDVREGLERYLAWVQATMPEGSRDLEAVRNW
jgi:UDP-glucose 4-epimerase